MFASVKVRNFDFCGAPLWVEVQEQQDHSHDEVNVEDHLMYEFSRMQIGNRLSSIIEKEPSFQWLDLHDVSLYKVCFDFKKINESIDVLLR